MAERKNTGIAVPDAKRLNDCYHELSEAIAARSAINGDRDLWQYDYAALPGGPEGAEREDWNHRCGSKDVALVALRGAVTNGNLQLWTYGSQGEGKVDHYELKEPTFRTFSSGTYHPDNRLLDNAGLADSPLWVKEADWHRFMLDLWAVRYGLDWSNPAPPADAPRLPPEGQFVTLSHALTWIAFGVSMGNDHLHEVLSQDRYGEHNPQEAIKAAVARLTALGSGGKIAMRGKHRSGRHDDEKTLLTEAIEPIRLTDYRQFSYLDDELRHGEGLLFWCNEDGTILDYVVGDGRKDSYLQVTVNRAELMREFPPPPKKMRTIFSPGELFTDDDPDHASPWWSVRQTLAWVATRTRSYVAAVGRAERDSSSELNWVVIQATLDVQLAESDEGKAYLSARQTRWPEGSIFAHAGREVLGEIEARRIAPATIEAGKRRVMGWHEFAGLGSSDTGSDWLDLDPQPLFSSAEVIAAFPALDRPAETEPSPKRARELPVWLNPYQLVAWVQYRDLRVVAKASDWNGLSAQHMYGDEPKVGTVADVEGALQEGRLIAQGYPKNGDSFAPIPAVEWSRIALAPLDQSRQHPYVRIQFDRRDVLAIFPAIGGESVAADQSNAETEAAAPRAPAVKAGRPPSDDEILAKADEMKARGMDGRTIAKEMRLEPSFQNVATTAVRELIKGRWKPGGRPKKGA